MDRDFYREYAEIEDTHWWFRGRRGVLARLMPQIAGQRGLRILDIGFGTGAMLRFLGEYGEAVGMDASLEAIRFARERCPQPMLVGDVSHLPLETGRFDLVTAFDVIEHVADDRVALSELGRVCRPGGHLLVTVPAFGFLWGNQDVVSHHKRRYSRAALGARVESAGLRIRLLTYFNALLFPAIAAVRLGRRFRAASNGPVQSDFGLTKPGVLNDLLARVFAAEGTIITRWRLPFGVSLLCLAQRPA